ncbi:MAG: DUF1572 domain-containing protein [Pyrinomonadaceae bacterium]|nr:DUF1572 domain-containing protein [Pyrinomonadaceae bacterium]
MTNQIIENYLSDAIQSFRNYKKLADKAIAQVSDEDFFRQIDAESNSIAIIIKHIAGNQISRWTDFLTTDGEKDFRNRDSEFISENETRESLLGFWERGWKCLFDALESLSVDDFSKTITIRGQAHTICEAINRQLTHYPMHIGQIIFLAKHFSSADWQTLSVPKNKSAQFNQFIADKKGETKKQIELAEEFGKK